MCGHKLICPDIFLQMEGQSQLRLPVPTEGLDSESSECIVSICKIEKKIEKNICKIDVFLFFSSLFNISFCHCPPTNVQVQ